MKEVKIVELIAEAAQDKKAKEIIILDVNNISTVTDEFVVCSANSTKQVVAIADSIEEKLRNHGISLLHKEGYHEGRWILMDYGVCVANIFIQEERIFYNLEQLWSDAKKYNYSDEYSIK